MSRVLSYTTPLFFFVKKNPLLADGDFLKRRYCCDYFATAVALASYSRPASFLSSATNSGEEYSIDLFS